MIPSAELQSVAVSDLHIGSRYFERDRFLAFLDHLPAHVGLILNGDVVTNPKQRLAPLDQAVLDRLVAESEQRAVVWIWGNHDGNYLPDKQGCIKFCRSHEIDHRLILAHGDYFDDVMTRQRWFMRMFRRFHALRVRLGAPPVHVAQYAKKWKTLYGFLCRNVARSAMEHAANKGFSAVACGHTHLAEEVSIGQTRYLNTGAWTELPTHCILVGKDSIKLVPTDDLAAWDEA